MQITLKEALDAHASLTILKAQPLSGRTAYALARFIQAWNKEMEPFGAARNALFERFSVEVPGKPDERQVPPDNLPEYQRQFDELLAQTIELPDTKIPVSELAGVKAEDLVAALWLLDEGEAAEVEAPA